MLQRYFCELADYSVRLKNTNTERRLYHRPGHSRSLSICGAGVRSSGHACGNVVDLQLSLKHLRRWLPSRPRHGASLPTTIAGSTVWRAVPRCHTSPVVRSTPPHSAPASLLLDLRGGGLCLLHSSAWGDWLSCVRGGSGMFLE